MSNITLLDISKRLDIVCSVSTVIGVTHDIITATTVEWFLSTGSVLYDDDHSALIIFHEAHLEADLTETQLWALRGLASIHNLEYSEDEK